VFVIKYIYIFIACPLPWNHPRNDLCYRTRKTLKKVGAKQGWGQLLGLITITVTLVFQINCNYNYLWKVKFNYNCNYKGGVNYN